MHGHRSFIAVSLASLASLAGCSDPSPTGTMSLRLVDAPYPFDLIASAEIDVRGAEVHVSAPDGASGFHAVGVPLQALNLLELTNGASASLGQAELPVGRVGQLRLLVERATVRLIDGREFDLDVPSGASSGLKVFFDPPLEIVAGEETELLLDVDVSRSFSAEPAAPTQVGDITGFRFHPVLRVAVTGETGTLAGRVTASADGSPIAGATVSLVEDGAIVAATASDAAGAWMILGVAPGERTVRAEAAGKTPVETTVRVDAGETTTVAGLELD